jgi:hypothetical protein
MSLTQSELIAGQGEDGLTNLEYLDGPPCALLQIGPSNAPRTFDVVDVESYAIAPNQTRYGIATEPHDYDLRSNKDPRVPYLRDRVYLVDARGRRVTREWAQGRWQFHIVTDGPQGRDARDLMLELDTFTYIPLLHGPPN